MAAYRYTRVNVFTERALTGNPLVVFTNATGLDTAAMQALAREMNLSECTFVLPPESGGTAKVRIFTPFAEVPFAGHPVIGTAFVLAVPLQADLLTLETGKGAVRVRIEREGARPVMGWMQAPLPTWSEASDSAAILLGLGVAQSQLPILQYDVGVKHACVALDTPERVRALKPDFGALAKLGPLGIAAFASDGQSVTLRVFVPGAGINEDPATGSAVTCLAVHMVRTGLSQSGDLITIHQGEQIARPSTLYARASMANGSVSEVTVGGGAVIVGRGEIHVASH